MTPDIGTDPVTGKALANWGQRVGATLIDFLIMLLPEVLLRSILGDAIGASIYLVVFGIYLVAQWNLFDGRTVGNRVAKTQILDAATGASITNKQAFNRYLYLELYAIVDLYGAVEGVRIVVVLAGIYGVVNVLLPLFDQRRQTLHDKFARTIVIARD
ncbi:MAG: RDD family protein [Acidimicrobiales bacterium]